MQRDQFGRIAQPRSIAPTAVAVAAFAVLVTMGLAAAYNSEILWNGEKAWFTR